jgi:ABC-type phosphate transport system substrate-binding protein
MKKKLFPILIILFIVINSVNAQSFKMIVNQSNKLTALTANEVSDFFLMKKNKWSDNTKVIPVDLGSHSDVRESFSKRVHKKSIGQVRAYWQQSVFSGKATPPREMKSDQDVIDFVKSNIGAIGYISASTSTEGVRVISIN